MEQRRLWGDGQIKRRPLTGRHSRADNGNRTRLSSLGSWRSTDELYLQGVSIKRKKLLTGIGPVTSALPMRRSTD